MNDATPLPWAGRLVGRCLRVGDRQLSEIDAHQRRIEAASAEPIALRAADLDFHGAVVEAAQNGPGSLIP